MSDYQQLDAALKPGDGSQQASIHYQQPTPGQPVGQPMAQPGQYQQVAPGQPGSVYQQPGQPVYQQPGVQQPGVYQQPGQPVMVAAGPTVVVGMAPAAWVPPTTPQEWSTGICDCFQDVSGCCDIYWCMACQVSRQCNASEGFANRMSAGYCLMTYCCCEWLPLIICQVRSKTVARYNIDEGCFMTFLCGFFCGGLSLCQTHRELTARGMWPGGTICQSAAPPIQAKMR